MYCHFVALLRLTVSQRLYIQGGPKTKPLPNYQKKLSNRIKVCPWG